jgi:RHS repeat-associated protein
VEDLYRTVDPNAPVLYDTFISQDVCVNSAGTVGSDDTLCPDLDGSQTNPPPFQGCEPDCTYGADPAILPASTPGCEAEGTCWQGDNMRFEVCRPLKCRVENVTPPPREAPAGGAGWRVARWHGDERGAREPAQVAEAPLPAPSLPWVAGAPGTANGAPAAPAGSLTATAPSASGSSIPFGDRLAELSLGLSAGRLSTPGPSPTRTEFVASGSDPGAGWELPDPPDTAPAARTQAGGISLPPLLIAGGSAKTFRWEFFAWDHLGSVRVVTDAAGTKVWETKYLPFGEEIGPPAPSENSHRFTGHERDGDIASDYMMARHYSPGLARFLSVDPEAAFGAPTLMNRLAYVAGDPINAYDPDGRFGRNHHEDLMNAWRYPPPFAEAVKKVDWIIPGAAALFHPSEHFGGMEKARAMTEEAIKAYRNGDKASAKKYLAVAAHTAMDAAAHKDANGKPVGPVKHLVCAAVYVCNPDKHNLEPKEAEAKENVAEVVSTFLVGTEMSRQEFDDWWGKMTEREKAAIEAALDRSEFERDYERITGKPASPEFGVEFPMAEAQPYLAQGFQVRIDGGNITDPVCGGRGGGRALCPFYDSRGRSGGRGDGF